MVEERVRFGSFSENVLSFYLEALLIFMIHLAPLFLPSSECVEDAQQELSVL